MIDLSLFEGKYRFANTVEIEIVKKGDMLLLQLGGLSNKYQAPLIYRSDYNYGLSYSNAEIRFSPPASGEAEILYWNGVPHYRPDPEDGPPAPFLFQPDMEINPQEKSEFENLLQNASLANGIIKYNLPYPKYELLYYLAKEKNVIFHGSIDRDISEFFPYRKTLDSHPHGNVKGIYATMDPIWPLFFAILNRTPNAFRIINGPSKFNFSDGTSQMLYLFSIGAEFLEAHPFTNGMVYIFDRSLFHISGGGEPEEAEWVCEHEIKPIFRLPIQPSDFPFINQIHPHILTKKQRELESLYPVIFQEFQEIVEIEDGIKINYAWSKQQLQNIADYVTLQRIQMTWMEFIIKIDPTEGIWLSLTGNPLIKSMVKKIMNEILKK